MEVSGGRRLEAGGSSGCSQFHLIEDQPDAFDKIIVLSSSFTWGSLSLTDLYKQEDDKTRV